MPSRGRRWLLAVQEVSASKVGRGMKRAGRQRTPREGQRIICRRAVVRWVLQRRLTTERSGVSAGDALRRAREEIAQLEAERVRLSADVMGGRPGALEEEERLRQRIAELQRIALILIRIADRS